VDFEPSHPDLEVAKLSSYADLKRFSCGDGDLDGFLKEDAITYQEKALVTTYLCLSEGEPVGFFSLCMDAIKLDDKEKAAAFGKDKPHMDFPALKLARLGVAKAAQHSGIGSFMVKYALGKAMVLSKQVGCRFVTVDAYPEENVVKFYERLGFVKNSKDKSGRNTSMRLDLLTMTS